MGQIHINIVGGFNPNESASFSAINQGHAAAVVAAIRWLEQERLPRACEQDRLLRVQGHYPRDGFSVNLDAPVTQLMLDQERLEAARQLIRQNERAVWHDLIIAAHVDLVGGCYRCIYRDGTWDHCPALDELIGQRERDIQALVEPLSERAE